MIPLILWLLAAPAGAQLSSGGNYQLDRSATGFGGTAQQGGTLSMQGLGGGSAGSEAVDGNVIGASVYDLRVGLFSLPPFSLQASTSTVLGLFNGAVNVAVPAGATSLSSYDIESRQDPAANPIVVNPSLILQANRKLQANDPLAQVQSSNILEFRAVDEQGYYNAALAAPVTLSFAYADADGDGVVDGTNPPVRAKTLAIWRLDETSAQWVKVPGTVVDTANHRVSAPVWGFGVFAYVGGVDQEVADAYAYPVPFRPHGPNAGTGPGQTGTDGAGITFNQLPSEGSIEIYTLTGELVRRIDIPLGLPAAKLAWDVRNAAGQDAVSGVYIWKVASPSAFKTGRLMVIR